MSDGVLDKRADAIDALNTAIYDGAEALGKAMRAAVGPETYGAYQLYAVRHAGPEELLADDDTADAALPQLLPPPLFGDGGWELLRDFLLWRERFDQDRQTGTGLGGAAAAVSDAQWDKLEAHRKALAEFVGRWNARPGAPAVKAPEAPPPPPPLPTLGEVAAGAGKALEEAAAGAAGAAGRAAGAGLRGLGGAGVVVGGILLLAAGVGGAVALGRRGRSR